MSSSGCRPSTPRSLSDEHWQHNPSTPSRLKQSHAPKPSPSEEPPSPTFETPASRFPSASNPFESPQRTNRADEIPKSTPSTPSPLRPRHWRQYSTHNCSQPDGEPCEHGTFSPNIKPTSPPTSVPSILDEESGHGHGGRYAGGQSIVGGANGVLGDAIGDTVFGDGNIFGGRGEHGKPPGWAESWRLGWGGGGDHEGGRGKKTMSTTLWLATKHGVQNKRRMYVSTLLPRNAEVTVLFLPLPLEADRSQYRP